MEASSGSLPVIVGLIVISLVFYAQDATFLSSRTLVNITLFAAPIGIIAIGVVLVLLLGEIDLSVGSVSGLAASVMAVMIVYHGQSLVLSIAAGLAVGLAIGVGYALLFTKVGVPSFVITLAGLLGFLGLQLVVLGKNGTVNLPSDSALLEFARASFLSPVASYVLVARGHGDLRADPGAASSAAGPRPTCRPRRTPRWGSGPR